MGLEEKAKEYALKALEGEIDKVKNAYIDGYNAARNELLHEPVDIDGVTYYDMSLPSGTMWSKKITYNQNSNYAILTEPYNKVKELSIPTKEDWEELEQNTKRTYYKGCLRYLSKDGVKLEFYNCSYWCKSDVNDKNEALVYRNGGFERRFTGESFRIVLVKKKK